MRLVISCILLVNSAIYAANGPVESAPTRLSTQTQQDATRPSDSKILGAFEVRPSYKSNQGEFHSEDSAWLGYQFNKNNSAVYKQEFNTNIYDPKLPAVNSGMNAYLADGYLKEKVNNIYVNGNLSLSYEGRQYLPTLTAKRDAGMFTALRNYAKLKYQATSSLALTAEEVPVVHLYRQAGVVTPKGPSANPDFENRASLGFEYAFSDSLKFAFPVLLSSVHTRAFDAKAANDHRWLHKVWLNPEIYYSVNSNLQVGVGYYSENLFKNDFAETTLTDGFKQGTTQVILSTSL